MERNSRTLGFSPLTFRVGALVAALVSAVALSGCKEEKTIAPPPPTTGALNVNVTPASASVVVTGPAGVAQQTFTGDKFLADLAPGQYSAKATALGFVDQSASINVVAGQTSSISLILQATPIIAAAPRAAYRDAQGNLIPLASSGLQSGQFVFYAWLQDLPLGIFPAELTSAAGGDPGHPLLAEQMETAPSFTQNLAAAWVGFTDPTGVVRPVIGADVRWQIDQQWLPRVGSTLFGTSDDNRVALGFGVDNNQADTRTNNAHLPGERFPLVATEFPLFNQTGIGTPFVDGFTWVTLFSPDKTAAARIVAVATINGEEVGKQILFKSFAPAPKIEITKTVTPAVVNLSGGTGTATFTVTVTNSGAGDATTVDLKDVLLPGAPAGYTIAGFPGTSDGAGGFTTSFPLVSTSTPAPPQTAQLLGAAQSFGVLGFSTVTNTGSSVVKGDVGVSAGSAVVGFPPGLVLSGTVHNNDAVAQAAQLALTAATVSLGALAPTAPTNTNLSSATLTPGVYAYDSSAQLTGPLVLDAQGDPTKAFVFQIKTTLTTAAGSSVSLINGASPCNVYWVVGSSATLGSTTLFAGNILANASITVGTGASISGRALASTGGVTLNGNAITAPLSCVAAPVSSRPLTFTATVTAPGTYCNQGQILSFASATAPFTPADLKAQACFTAVQPNLSIVKDFVADDNTTSLGKALTLAANEHAKLRVRVVNDGTGPASTVAVNDVLNATGTGLLANYQFLGVSSGTANTSGGFDTTIGTLAAGATTTLLFTVAASVDATYCDTATVTAAPGTLIGVASDSACLTVATPKLTITKADAPAPPASVLPGASYTSTIVVQNTGTATAKNVVISDLVGSNAAANVQAIYVSSSSNGASGTLTNNVVKTNAVDVLAGGSMTFKVVSRIPPGAVSGTYCDTASVTSSNAVSPPPAQACVNVPAFAAQQTQLVDQIDPITVGSNETYFAVMSVEKLSNEGISHNVITFSFGLPNPTSVGIAGLFQIVSTKVYLDSSPVIDPTTGIIVSGPTSPTAVLQTEGADYTVVNSTGLQVLTMTPSVILQPGTALYAVQVVLVPAGMTPAPPHQYTTAYIWRGTGLLSTIPYQGSSSEPTTVLP